MAPVIIHNFELSHRFWKSCAKILAHARGAKACQDNILASLTRASKNMFSKKMVSKNMPAKRKVTNYKDTQR
jgi:hypothetical protein